MPRHLVPSTFLAAWKALSDLFLFTKCSAYLCGTNGAWPIVAAADAKKEDLLAACSLFQTDQTHMPHADARTRTHPHAPAHKNTHTHTHTTLSLSLSLSLSHPSSRFNVLHRYVFNCCF